MRQPVTDERPLIAIREFATYTAASAIALALDYAVYWLLAGRLGIGPAAAVGYAVGLVLAYVLMSFGVFAHRARTRRRRSQAALFLVSGLIGLALTYVTATLVSRLTGGNLHAAKLTAVATSFVTVYLFRKFVVFGGSATPR